MVSVTSSGVSVASELPVTEMVRSFASTRTSRLEQEESVRRETVPIEIGMRRRVFMGRLNLGEKIIQPFVGKREEKVKDVKFFFVLEYVVPVLFCNTHKVYPTLQIQKIVQLE